MENLSAYELENIDGGKLSSLSDWLLLGGSLCLCFCSPAIGAPVTIITAGLS